MAKTMKPTEKQLSTAKSGDVQLYNRMRFVEIAEAVHDLRQEFLTYLAAPENKDRDDAPPSSFWSAGDNLLRKLGYLPFGSELSPLVRAAEDWAASHVRYRFWEGSRFIAGEDRPESGYYAHLEQLLAAFDTILNRKPPKIEPMPDLFEQKVGDKQIAAIHGCDEEFVRRVRDNPELLKGYRPPKLDRFAQEEAARAQEWSTGCILSISLNKLEAILAGKVIVDSPAFTA